MSDVVNNSNTCIDCLQGNTTDIYRPHLRFGRYRSYCPEGSQYYLNIPWGGHCNILISQVCNLEKAAPHYTMHGYCTLREFRNVFKFHAYFVDKRLFWRSQSLPVDCPTWQQLMHSKWILATEIILKEAGEWNGSPLGISRTAINLNTLRNWPIKLPCFEHQLYSIS